MNLEMQRGSDWERPAGHANYCVPDPHSNGLIKRVMRAVWQRRHRAIGANAFYFQGIFSH